MRIKVENTWYDVVMIERSAVSDISRSGILHIAGYGIKICTAQQPLLNALMTPIQDLETKVHSTFFTWLKSAKVYAGTNCLICADLYTGEGYE